MTSKNKGIKITKNRTHINESLVTIGLTEDQATIYELLAENGPLRAQRIAVLAGFSRPLAYKILDQLISIGLVNKAQSKTNKTTIFEMLSPHVLETLANYKKNEYEKAQNALEHSLTKLVSQFNLFNGKPNVRFFEGVEGIKKLYEDILREDKDILLLRSFLDQTNQDMKEVVSKQIKSQVNRNIHTRAITPLDKNLGNIKELVKNDEALLVERRFINQDKFLLTAQIIVYGNKVAITSYKQLMITTITESEDISESFRILFELIWSQADEPGSVEK